MIEPLAQLVFPGFKFGIDDPAEAEALVDLGVGGFCLYGGHVREVAEFTARLRRRAKVPLLFCADYEDGVASQSPGGTPLSSNMGLGAAGDESLARRKAVVTADEARALGVAWVLAPVVDLATRAANPIVNIRSFGESPELVSRLARAYIEGLGSRRVLSCLKHFPGHGDVVQDSHLELARVEASRDILSGRDLVPFRELARGADSVMTAHLLVPALETDGNVPASLSREAVGFLRRELGFDGLVSTDALTMHAIASHHQEEEAAVLALLAGSDVLLVPRKPRELIYGLLDRVESEPALASAVSAASRRLGLAVKRAEPGTGPLSEDEFARVGCPQHREIARGLAEACLAWAKQPPASRLPASVRYLEPEADGPEEWNGTSFVAELRAGGVAVSAGAETLVIGCFMSPRAYTGRIRYEPELIREVGEAAAKAKSCWIISFGSPFVFQDFGRCDAGLCAFSGSEYAQAAAARALTGRLKVGGRMPVSLA